MGLKWTLRHKLGDEEVSYLRGHTGDTCDASVRISSMWQTMEMKRTLALTLTVAMVGGLMFMGFAGTAAAQDGNISVDQTTGDATATTDVDVDQENNNDQIGVSGAFADASSYNDDGYDKKKGGGASSSFAGAEAASAVEQDQTVVQGNNADVDADSDAASGNNSIAVDVALGGFL